MSLCDAKLTISSLLQHSHVKAPTLFPTQQVTQMHTKATICHAICQVLLDLPLNLLNTKLRSNGFGCPVSLYISNVNITRYPGEWLKPNTPPRSICLLSDPLWCHVIPLEVWKDMGSLSSACSTSLHQATASNEPHIARVVSGCQCEPKWWSPA